ncbi:MAG: DUF3662 and FHA domain-containing protein [Acidimicrobiia bacterium]|nr:DUF3662 and FHA domain-containing protein [Acidimicrobiia bacterium]
MALRAMEGQIEEFVESLMARAFGSGLQPVEVGRRLRRVVLRDRRVNVKGVVTVANRFVVDLSPEDHQRLQAQSPSILRDLVDEIRSVVAGEQLTFAGPVSVAFTENHGRRRGTFSIERAFDDGPTVRPADLVLSDGRNVDLGSAGLRIGRHPDNDIVIDESNVSRFHAQVVPEDDHWVVIDNHSTNGTRVNDRRVGDADQTEIDLTDGDTIIIGPASFTFRSR